MQYFFIAATHFVFGNMPLGYIAYQAAQKRLGGLRNPRYEDRLKVHTTLLESINDAGFSVKNKRIMEVGTGRVITCPIGFYLAGSGAIDTYDVTPFLDKDLTMDLIGWIRKNKKKLEDMYGDNFSESRYQDIIKASSVNAISDICNINFKCPADASATASPDGFYDIHVSQNTFEHIPPKTLRSIIAEGKRVLAADGIACHLVDHSDHWAKRTKDKNSAYFLKFSDTFWNFIAGNKYAYHNRLRSPEIRKLFLETGFAELLCKTYVDKDAEHWVRENAPVSRRYGNMSISEIATHESIIVATKR